MSNPELKKADGCDVFFSLIIVIVLLAGFFIFQALSEPEEPREVDYKTEQERLEIIAKHTATYSDYNARIDSFHSENNSSMEKTMTNVINQYKGK
jgi:uncharacterized protein YpmS